MGQKKQSMYVENIGKKIFKFFENKEFKFIKSKNCIFEPAATFYMINNPYIYKDNTNYIYSQRCNRPEDSNLFVKADRKAIHHQVQILDKSGKNPLLIVEELLEYLGLDFKLVYIDIDNWSNRIIGCYGKGWEVQYKGVEIMQITCIDKMLSKNVSRSVVEYAIGLERIAMCMCNYDDYYKLYKDKYYAEVLKSLNLKMFQLIETINSERNIQLYLDNIKSYLIEILLLKLKNFNRDVIYNRVALISHLFNIVYATKSLHYVLRAKLIQTICRIVQVCLI